MGELLIVKMFGRLPVRFTTDLRREGFDACWVAEIYHIEGGLFRVALSSSDWRRVGKVTAQTPKYFLVKELPRSHHHIEPYPLGVEVWADFGLF